MTKKLEQIQEENRKFILSALKRVKDPLSKDLFNSKPLTLSIVLLAFKNKNVKTGFKDEIIFYIASSQFCGLKLEEEYTNPHYSLWGVGHWNLELETLEEQTEETQRGINNWTNKN